MKQRKSSRRKTRTTETIRLTDGQEFCCDELRNWKRNYGSVIVTKLEYKDSNAIPGLTLRVEMSHTLWDVSGFRICPFCEREL